VLAALLVAAAVAEAAPALRDLTSRLLANGRGDVPPSPLLATTGAAAAVAAVAVVVSVVIGSAAGAHIGTNCVIRTSAGGRATISYGAGAASMAQPELAEIASMDYLATHELVTRCCS
jgi:hypothetical protein